MFKEIYLDAPNVGELEKKYLCEAIDSGFVSSVGPFVSEFEKRAADYLDIKGAVSVQSGTAAIHMALYELGIGPGDEVIVPALTFIATVNPIIYVGATPVFVDVDINTWDIDPGKIKEAITDKTKAIIPVHLYGNPCNMEEIMEIAKKNNLFVIEDSTESLGSSYKDKFTGTFGDFGCFSFNGNKTITTGGGGMIVSNNIEKIEHIRYLVNQSKDKDRPGFHSEIGFNYRMTNIEASLGLAQMEKLDGFLDKKRKFNEIYRKQLRMFDFIRFQEEYDGVDGFYWLSCIIFEKDIHIIELQKALKNKGISTRRIFTPIVEFPPYKKYQKKQYRNSNIIYEKGLCLPSSTLSSEEDIVYVCKTLKTLIH